MRSGTSAKTHNHTVEPELGLEPVGQVPPWGLVSGLVGNRGNLIET